MEEENRKKNFIKTIIAEDLANGKNSGKSA